MSRRNAFVRPRQVSTVALVVLVLVLISMLAACGPTPAPTAPQVQVVTATFTPEQVVQVVTATFTPGAAPQVVTATFTPEAAAPADTEGPPPTYTPYPTYTPQPTFTPPPPPTDTPIPPTQPPKPTAKPQPTNTPVKAYPPPMLINPPPMYNCYNQGGCDFSWSWGGALKANEYFQVQLVGPENEHRGIHPPTKGYTFSSDETVYLIIPDWCNTRYYCQMKWTVAIIEWDGVDPGKIGRTIIEAEIREVVL